MPSPRSALALAVMTLAATAVPAAAKAKPDNGPRPAPCQAPASGFHSCLSVIYVAADDGSVQDARVVATVVGREAACTAGATKRRRVTISRGRHRLTAARPSGRCRHGVTTWRATFAPKATAAWNLRRGDVVRSAWAGVKHPSKVKLT